MTKIKAFEEISGIFSEVKSSGKGFITNFYPDHIRVNLWIENEALSFRKMGATFFFFRQNNGFVNLFYAAPDIDSLDTSLTQLINGNDAETYVIDIVENKVGSKLQDIFLEKNFSAYTSLVRMNRVAPVGELAVNEENVILAGKEECQQIKDLFDQYFDPLAEQIPSVKELDYWISGNNILVFKDKDKVAGFIIFELMGVTLYLKYWFVHPDHRDQRIGSKLFKKFFFIGQQSKRQLFWVIESNENAIKRYRHFGFKEESLFNHILINKNIRYEQENH